jgi:isopenicillin-N epimerase
LNKNPKKDALSDRIRLPAWDHCHKWLCAPKGAAFLYARREVQPLLEPLVVSWGWNRGTQTSQTSEVSETSEVSGPRGLLALGESTSRFVDEQEWQGTRDPAAYLSVPAAIQFQAEHHWQQVRQECHQLVRYARQAIGKLTGLEQICPDSAEWYAQMAALPLPACDGAALQRRLWEEHRIEVPITEWNGRQLVRVSVQVYNTKDDTNALIEGLERLLLSATRK